jgi:hypothetical protein
MIYPSLLAEIFDYLQIATWGNGGDIFRNVDPRICANIASDFLHPASIPVAVGLPEACTSYTFQDLCVEFDSIVAQLETQRATLPPSLAQMVGKIITHARARKRAFLELLGAHNILFSDGILHIAVRLWVDNVTRYFNLHPEIVLNQKQHEAFDFFAQFIRGSVVCSQFEEYKQHVRVLAAVVPDPDDIRLFNRDPRIYDVRVNFKRSLLLCFNPLVNLSIMCAVMNNHKSPIIWVMAGAVHVNAVAHLLINSGFYRLVHKVPVHDGVLSMRDFTVCCQRIF